MTTLLVLLLVGPVAADEPKGTVVQNEVKRLQIPEKLIPKNKEPLFLVRAEGVQIYRAQRKNGALQWVFQAPEAVLLDYKTGEKTGTHGKDKGPVWIASDGSKLTGKPVESALAPNANAIPWLLLEGKNENGGQFKKVTHIQRVDTWAGQAPAVKPAKEDEVRKVRYHATYVFWGDH